MGLRAFFQHLHSSSKKEAKIGVYAFFALLTIPVLVVVLLIYAWIFYNLVDIRTVADRVREVHLSAILDTQRTLVNIENLRRNAQVVYVTDDPDQRRRARLNAQALTHESVFETNSRFSFLAERAGLLIAQLADIRTRGDGVMRRLNNARLRFMALVGELRGQNEALLRKAGIVFPAALPEVSVVRSQNCAEGESGVLFAFRDVMDACRKLPADTGSEITRLASGLLGEAETIVGYCGQKERLEEEARKIWTDFDALLRQLSDTTSNAETDAVYETMGLISSETLYAGNAFLLSFVFLVVLFFVLFRAIRHCVLAPLSLAESELDRIGRGEALGAPLQSRIRELAALFTLLPRLAEHMGKLAARSGTLEKEKELYVNMSLTDALTGVNNRRSFDLHLSRYAPLDPLSILMIDIDWFKLYNDAIGHQAGDSCLAKVAACLQKGLLRSSDAVFRYGGEEFAVLLPGGDSEQARRVAERLARAVRDECITHPVSEAGPCVTISIGIASRQVGDVIGNAELLARADQALYAAKAAGRNCIQVFG